MKKLWILIILFPAVLCLVSCEKENGNVDSIDVTKNYNAKFEQTGDPYDYVIVNPEWQLIDAAHTDKFGNIGELYVNLNNPIETLFYIKVQSKTQICTTYQGIWDAVYVFDEATQSMKSVQTCTIADENQNCGCQICTENKKLVSVSMWSLKI